MFCFRCGASMPEESTVCPQCATPVANAPIPPPPPPPGAPAPQYSAWLDVPQVQPANPQIYPPSGRGFAQPPTDGQAIASLVLGIVSLIFCLNILTGIPAIILGHRSWSRIRASMGRMKGEGIALAGLVLGYVSIPWLLVVASAVIPNFARSRIVANENAAASTLRTINVAQLTYSTSFPDRGYAPDLATLGPGQRESCTGPGDGDHACLLDNVLGNASCTAGLWCTKNGYRFTLSREGACGQRPGTQEDGSPDCTYVVVATPLNPATGRRNFCATADAVIRYQRAVPLLEPIGASQCENWSPVT